MKAYKIEMQVSFEEFFGEAFKNKKIVQFSDIGYFFIEESPGQRVISPVDSSVREIPSRSILGFIPIVGSGLDATQFEKLFENAGLDLVLREVDYKKEEILKHELNDQIAIYFDKLLLGVFVVSGRKSIVGINPKSNKRIKIPAVKKIQFKLSKETRTMIEKDYKAFVRNKSEFDEESGEMSYKFEKI